MTRAEAVADAVSDCRRDGGGCVAVHRDLGPGFTHQDSDDCECGPVRVVPGAPGTVADILARVDAAEVES